MTTPELLVLETLHPEFGTEVTLSANEGTLADFLGDYIGRLDSGEVLPGDARMSENIGERFAEGMLEKHKAVKR